MRKRRRQREKQFVVLFLSLFLIAASVCIWTAWFAKTTIEPNMAEIGRIRAKSLITRTVSTAVYKRFRRGIDAEKLLHRKTNAKGEVEMLQADTGAMNLLMTEISQELQKSYENMKEEKVSVPAGSLLGSKFFSQTGPNINLRVIPLSVSGMDFKTEFESQGINQTKYKVYIILRSEVKVLAPFSSATFHMASTILVAEAVILGNVPQSYVQVPKEDILDVT